MPLPMVHLSTAVKISTIQGLKSPEFYLGSISPDAVHMRTGFVRDDKTRSHCNARVLASIDKIDSITISSMVTNNGSPLLAGIIAGIIPSTTATTMTQAIGARILASLVLTPFFLGIYAFAS